MKPIAVLAAVLALVMSSPFAFAHKHKGWGCHKHPNTYGGRYHCGNGSH